MNAKDRADRKLSIIFSKVQRNVPFEGFYADEESYELSINRLEIAIDDARDYAQSLLLKLADVQAQEDFYRALCFGIDSDVCVHYTEDDTEKCFRGEVVSVGNGFVSVTSASLGKKEIGINSIETIEILKEKGGEPDADSDNKRSSNRQGHRGEEMRHMRAV